MSKMYVSIWEPVVKQALEDWSPRSVCCAIYGLATDYDIGDDIEDYLYGIADPDNESEMDDDYQSPCDDWWSCYPCPDLEHMRLEMQKKI